MPGVYAQGLCKDAKPTKHTQPFTGERGQGDRDNKSEVNFKNILFLQAGQAVFRLLRLSINLYNFRKWVFSVACYVGFASLQSQLFVPLHRATARFS